jgi:glycosyltransferase involved in cell wall biosynthesis
MIKVSVVIPTYKRQVLLQSCLEQLCRQDLDPSFYEIIVADDENSPKTSMLVRDMQKQCPRHQLIYTPVGPSHGPAAARNCGWRIARGRIIAFTDDDCLPNEKWLSKAIEHFSGDIGALWGQVIVPLPKDPTDYQVNMAGLSKGEFVTANCFCRKGILRKIRGFDERFYKAWREDSDLYFTLLEEGVKIKFVYDVMVYHPARPGRFGISVAMQRNNLFEALLYKKHRTLYRRYVNFPILNLFYAIIACLFVLILSLILGWNEAAEAAFFIWSGLTASFVSKRLRNSSHRLKHVWEMIVTSILIPPVAVFWRIVGYLRFKPYADLR